MTGNTLMAAFFQNGFNDVDWLSLSAERFDVSFTVRRDLVTEATENELKINVGGRKAVFKAVLRVDHVFRNRFQSIERDLELDRWFALLASQQDITTIFSVPRFEIASTTNRGVPDDPITIRFNGDFYAQPLGVSLDGNQYIFVNDLIAHYTKRYRAALKQATELELSDSKLVSTSSAAPNTTPLSFICQVEEKSSRYRRPPETLATHYQHGPWCDFHFDPLLSAAVGSIKPPSLERILRYFSTEEPHDVISRAVYVALHQPLQACLERVVELSSKQSQ